MQVRRIVVFLAIVCLLPCLASAQTALQVSPSTLTPGDEAFLTIFLQGTLETDVIAVAFAGPGGQVSVEPSVRNAQSIVVWVPGTVLYTEGQYSVDVYVTRGSDTFHFGPGVLTIAFPPPDPNPPLLLNAPEAITAEVGAGGTAVVTFSVIASDGTPVICTPPSGSTFALGATTVTCTANNGFEQASVEFPVFLQDTTPPVMTLPADFSTNDSLVTFTVTATDTNDPNPDVFCFPASGTLFPGGATTVQCFAVDFHANYAFGSFKVTVTGGAPLLTIPDDIVAEATSAAGATVTFDVEATEGGTIECSPESGSVFPVGITTVSCTATNAIGSDTQTFKITVVDTTPPTLQLPTLITAEATSAAGAVVTYVTTATDLVSGSVAVSCTPVSGSTFPLGTTTVHCSATDAANNTANGMFGVLVQDTTPPVIILVTPSLNSLWPPDHKMVPITVSVVAIDSVDPAPTVQILSVDSNQPVNGIGDGDTSPDWEITGPLSVDLRAERTGTQDRIYTITVQATDSSGNSTTSTCEVRVTQSRRRR